MYDRVLEYLRWQKNFLKSTVKPKNSVENHKKDYAKYIVFWNWSTLCLERNFSTKLKVWLILRFWISKYDGKAQVLSTINFCLEIVQNVMKVYLFIKCEKMRLWGTFMCVFLQHCWTFVRRLYVYTIPFKNEFRWAWKLKGFLRNIIVKFRAQIWTKLAERFRKYRLVSWNSHKMR